MPSGDSAPSRASPRAAPKPSTWVFGKPDEAFATLSEKDNARIKLLWIACGKSDFLLKQNQDFIAWLKTKNINHKYVETEGAHTWLVWRRYLIDFMSQVQW